MKISAASLLILFTHASIVFAQADRPAEDSMFGATKAEKVKKPASKEAEGTGEAKELSANTKRDAFASGGFSISAWSYPPSKM